MFDLHNNLLTTLLAGTLGALGLIAVTQTVFLGRTNVDAIAPMGGDAAQHAGVDTPETGLPEVNEYRVITDVPLFFADRRLPPVMFDGTDEGEEEVEEPPMIADVGELNIALTGIIIDPEMRIALVTDRTSNETHVMREGMALEGEQAAWSLASLTQRNARFVSADGREQELELEVYTSQLAAASIQDAGGQRETEGRRRGRERGEPDAEARARAEEVRRRVAERRAELRAEAERRRQQREQ